MAPKRSSSRAAKQVSAQKSPVEGDIEEPEVATKKPRSSRAATKATPAKSTPAKSPKKSPVVVELKTKSRGRPKKAVAEKTNSKAAKQKSAPPSSAEDDIEEPEVAPKKSRSGRAATKATPSKPSPKKSPAVVEEKPKSRGRPKKIAVVEKSNSRAAKQKTAQPVSDADEVEEPKVAKVVGKRSRQTHEIKSTPAKDEPKESVAVEQKPKSRGRPKKTVVAKSKSRSAKEKIVEEEEEAKESEVANEKISEVVEEPKLAEAVEKPEAVEEPKLEEVVGKRSRPGRAAKATPAKPSPEKSAPAEQKQKTRGRSKKVVEKTDLQPAKQQIAPEKSDVTEDVVSDIPDPQEVKDKSAPKTSDDVEMKESGATNDVTDASTSQALEQKTAPSIPIDIEMKESGESDNVNVSNKRKILDETLEEIQSKKVKVQPLPIVKLPKLRGRVMTCGSDSAGELGLRTIGKEKFRPTIVPDIDEPVCLVAAGAMHTVAVNADGSKIYTFGCNDELALGRKTAVNGTGPPPPPSNENVVDPDKTEIQMEEEIPEAIPTAIQLPNRAVKVTAGDSHTAALTEQGALYAWGCFRDQCGRIGLIPDGTPRNPIGSPVAVMPFEVTVVDIASGDNHVVALSDNGQVYTFGVGEQGQLGRMEKDSKVNEEYSNVEGFLKPQIVTIGNDPDIKCDRVWAGAFSSFARTVDGAIYAWGLNNYSQLGFPKNGENIVEDAPKRLEKFCDSVELIAGGMHHTLALDSNGRVYSCGRYHYGRLGHPDVQEDVRTPKLIEALKDEKVISLACGINCSFAVTESGNLYSWGTSAMHLGHSKPSDEDSQDILVPSKVTCTRLENTSFYAVSAGSQHVAVIASGEQQNGN